MIYQVVKVLISSLQDQWVFVWNAQSPLHFHSEILLAAPPLGMKVAQRWMIQVKPKR